MCSARSIPILGLCALATSLTLGCLPSKNAKPRPLASRGVIDLREWDFEKDGPIDLKGEWEFYWKKLLAPSDLASAGPRPALAKSYIQAPGKWNAHVVDGKEIGGQGFATYRLKVLLPPKSEGLGFHIPDGQGSAHETYVGSQLVAHNGKVGQVADAETPQYLPQYGAFPEMSELFVSIHISNHVHQNGGQQTPIRIGLQATFQTVRDRARLLEGFLAGALFIMGLYHFALFFYRRKDRAAFWFGLLCLIMGLRLAVTGQRLLIEAAPDFPWIVFFKLEYLTLYALLPAWAIFVYVVYPRQFGRFATRLIVSVSLIASAAVLFLPATLFTHTLVPFELFVVLAFPFGIYAIIRAAFARQQGARFMLAGFLIFFATAINDMLYNQFLLGLGFIMPLGLFFCIFAQAGALAHRIAVAFNTSEDLSANLELKVDERTTALENAKQDTENLNSLIKSLNENIDIGIIMQKIHSYIKTTYSIQYYGLAVVDRDKQRLVTIATASPDFLTEEQNAKINAFTTLTINTVGAHALAFKAKRPSFFPRIRISGMTPEELYNYEVLKLKSLLIIPLILQNEPIGFLDLYNLTKMELSKDEISKLSILGEQLAGIIHGSSLYKEVEVERSKSEKLLLNILPENVAIELKQTGMVAPQHFASASVLFTDFVGFTTISETMSAADLVKELDGCFSQFDEVIKRNNLEKLKTIGDAYMCAGGIPAANTSHALDTCLAALEFRAFMLQMQRIKAGLGLPYWRLRIGINTGPVTAGVVGTNKFAYDIWGDTVNTASRMESSGEPGHVNISQATYDRVKDFFDCEYRGKVKAKGKGEVEMYFLLRIKPEFSADAEGRIPNAEFEMQRVAAGV